MKKEKWKRKLKNRPPYKRIAIGLLLILISNSGFAWGFFGHRLINYHAVFLLPPQMMILFKSSQDFLVEHAVDPDKRRYMIAAEGPRHYIDLDHYGNYPFDSLPRKWQSAVAKYTEDSLQAHGVVPWWLETMLSRLTTAFKEKNKAKILRVAAELGHYIADAHVPLHTTRNHNGQYTGQKGIHGFWESRVPELLAEQEWDFFIGQAIYIKHPSVFIWKKVLESAAAADSVLKMEKQLSKLFPADKKYAFEERNGQVIRVYSSAYSKAYDGMLKGMIERRMQQSILAVASFWYTAWINAGQPDLSQLTETGFTTEEKLEFENLNNAWKSGSLIGREHADH